MSVELDELYENLGIIIEPFEFLPPLARIRTEMTTGSLKSTVAAVRNAMERPEIMRSKPIMDRFNWWLADLKTLARERKEGKHRVDPSLWTAEDFEELFVGWPNKRQKCPCCGK
jgi:hypothetical protein